MPTPAEAVLGMCMREPSALDVALSLGLSPTHFDDEFQGQVFGAMIQAEKERRDFDLPALGVIFPTESIRLVNYHENAPISQNPDFYVRGVLTRSWRLAAQRKLLELMADVQSYPDLEPVQHLQERITRALEQLAGGPVEARTVRDMRSVLQAVVANVEEAMKAQTDGRPVAITSGIPALDYVVGGGWRKKRVTSLCARSGRGKTTMGLCFARNAILTGKKAVYFSTEAGPEELVEKIVANQASVNMARIINGSMSPDEADRFMYAVEQLAKTSLFVDDEFGGDMDKLETSLRRLKRRDAADLVVIDYVQQCREPGLKHAHKPQEVARVTARIKRLAMELDVPIVMLAQLNRLVDKDDAFPTVADIADSSSIEKDSDHVLILHWVDDSPTTQRPVLRVAKNRLGMKDVDVELTANLGFGRFEGVQQ